MTKTFFEQHFTVLVKNHRTKFSGQTHIQLSHTKQIFGFIAFEKGHINFASHRCMERSYALKTILAELHLSGEKYFLINEPKTKKKYLNSEFHLSPQQALVQAKSLIIDTLQSRSLRPSAQQWCKLQLDPTRKNFDPCKAYTLIQTYLLKRPAQIFEIYSKLAIAETEITLALHQLHQNKIITIYTSNFQPVSL